MFEVTLLCGQMCIGKQGENLARVVYFSEAEEWKKIFGEGRCELLHQRNGDAVPYPVALDVEDGKVCWKVTNADTAVVGEGKCELHYLVDDKIVKSKTWTTTVLPSLGEDIAEPPEPQKAWVDQVLGAADEVKSATTHQPMIGENKNWFVWNAETQEYVDTGVSAEGQTGDPSDMNIENGEGDCSFKQKTWDEQSKNFSEGYSSTALGAHNKSKAPCSMAVNYNNEVNAENAFAANSGNKINEAAEGSFVAGHRNEAVNKFQTVFGTYALIDEDTLFAVGNGNQNNKSIAFEIDRSANATVFGSFGVKGNAKVEGNFEMTNGNATVRGVTTLGTAQINKIYGANIECVATGEGSAGFNIRNKVYGKNSFAALSNNEIGANYESVFIAGHCNKAAASHQAIFGTYASPGTGDAFVVGNGSSAKGNSNAFAVAKNGNIRIGGNTITIGSTTITEEQLKKLLAMI